MSDIRHRIWIGAPTIVDIDQSYIPAPDLSFTTDRIDIFSDSTTRTIDEE